MFVRRHVKLTRNVKLGKFVKVYFVLKDAEQTKIVQAWNPAQIIYVLVSKQIQIKSIV